MEPKKTAMQWMREVAKIAPICDLRKVFGEITYYSTMVG